MRITNSMMTNNMLLNMNRNLTKLDKLENQMATGKKIQFPSDNPIIAGKSLKLRTNLYETDQHQNNIGDANAWMSISEKAAGNISSITGRIRDLCVQGASGTLDQSDREKIGEEIKQLREQIVQEANTSNGGRYVFSGHKTNQKLMFDSTVNQNIKMMQQFKTTDMQQLTVNSNYRYKLPYSDIMNTIKVTIGLDVYTEGDPSFNIVEKSYTDADAYTPPPAGPGNTIHMIKETGELVFEQAHYTAISNPVPSTISVEYEKSKFNAGDLNPVHYFDTIDRVNVGGSVGMLDASGQVQLPFQDIKSINAITVGGAAPSAVIYANSTDIVALGATEVRVDMDTGMITAGALFAAGDNVDIDFYDVIDKLKDENIDYEVSVNTKMTINTLGKNLITLDMVKDIDDLINSINFMNQSDLGKAFSSMLTKVDGHDKNILKAQASIGSKMNRLELIQSRLDNDKINYTQLMSDNEDADLSETITQLNTQEMVYKASLSASAKIIQQSLVDFLR